LPWPVARATIEPMPVGNVRQRHRGLATATATATATILVGLGLAPGRSAAHGPRDRVEQARVERSAPGASDDETAPASRTEVETRRCPTHRPRLGPADAPIRVLLFIDPTSPGAHTTWLEARRIVGEYDGRVRIELGVAQSHYGQPAATRDAQAFALAAIDADPNGDASPLLALMARRGWRAVTRRLAIAEDRAQLAQTLGLAPEAIEQRWAERDCLDRQVRQETERLFALERARLGGNTVPLPVAITIVPGHPPAVKQEDERLDGMRLRIDAAITSWRRGPEGAAMPPPREMPTAPPPNPLRDEPGLGMTIGAFGAPHHLAIYADSEVSTLLQRSLEAGLAFRERRPAQLSIQVVARGGSTRSIALRRRLCAARAAGLTIAYAEHLARTPDTRALLPARELLDRLDAVAEQRECRPWETPGGASADESPEAGTETSTLALPRGVWLDGQLLQSADLPLLAARLRSLGVGAAPWLWPGLAR